MAKATSSVEGSYYKAEGGHELYCQVSELWKKPKGYQMEKGLIGEGFSHWPTSCQRPQSIFSFPLMMLIRLITETKAGDL